MHGARCGPAAQATGRRPQSGGGGRAAQPEFARSTPAGRDPLLTKLGADRFEDELAVCEPLEAPTAHASRPLAVAAVWAVAVCFRPEVGRLRASHPRPFLLGDTRPSARGKARPATRPGWMGPIKPLAPAPSLPGDAAGRSREAAILRQPSRPAWPMKHRPIWGACPAMRVTNEQPRAAQREPR